MVLSDYAVRQRVSVVVLAAIIFVVGLQSYMAMPREAAPDITIPYVFVSASYKGASAEDMETSITIPIEKKIKGIEGIKQVRSISSEGNASIVIEFVTGTDIDIVLQKVRNKVDEAGGDLPQDMENDPTVFEVNISEMPIVVFSLSGTCGTPCLKELADDLKDEFEGVPGVLEAVITGGLEREIRVEVIPEKLAYYGIPITAFQGAVSGENQNTSGGSITLGQGRFQLSVPGEFETPEALFGLVVGTHEGQPVYLRDVATVIDGYKEATSRSRLGGVDAVSIAVKKRAGENAIFITDELDRIIGQSQSAWPTGTSITKLMDQAKEIRMMVADLENNILSGLVLVVVVILFFLGTRNAVLVSLAIPFSMLMSFAVLHAMGVTLNNVVLYSLTLALGMLVDNAIVIVENIYRHMSQGVPRLRAAMHATGEVAWPVIGSTLTTLAAFSPMLFWPGIMGEFMGYMPLTLIVTLTSSLLVALVINPALAAMLMKLKDSHEPVAVTEGTETGEEPVHIKGWMLTAYVAVLRAALKHRGAVLAGSVLSVVLLVQVWLLAVGVEKPVEFFPEIDPNSVYINIDLPEGASLEYADRMVKQVEAAVNGMPSARILDPAEPLEATYRESLGLKNHVDATGREFSSTSDLPTVTYVYAKAVVASGGAGMFEQAKPTNVSVQFVDFSERTEPTADTADAIRERVAAIPGAHITVDHQQHGPPTGAALQLEISGEDFAVLGQIARRIRDVLEAMPHVEDVTDDYVEGTPTVRVIVDRQRAAMYGLSTGSIGFALKTGYNGMEASTYREAGDDFDITVRLPEADREVADVLRELMIPTPTGQLVPLTALARVEFGGSVGNITRVDYDRVVTVKANVDADKLPGAVARAKAQELLAGLDLPPGYHVRFAGEDQEQRQAEEFLGRAFLIAIFLIFLILVTMFNSVSQPFIIMTSVALSLGGAFLGLAFIKSPFGIIMSGVGIISLAGVVVNNGIVLIDYINKLMERGYPLEDAIVMGGATRLRPVLLTAITTTLGLIPMVTGVSYDFHVMAVSWASESSQWWRSMAIVVIFGLLVATVLTLVVTPVLLHTLERARRSTSRGLTRLRRLYWLPYERITGERVADPSVADESGGPDTH